MHKGSRVIAMTYARNTTVSAIRTRNEIEETLERYGADGFAYATQGNLATVIFAMENRRIRFVLELPDPEEFRYTNHSPPRERSDRAQREAYDQACRQRWRALLLVIKAKLEAVTAGISTIETEFLANIVLPDNTTAGEWMLPQIDRAYRTGEMPPLLPAAGHSDPSVNWSHSPAAGLSGCARSWNRRSTVAKWPRRAGTTPVGGPRATSTADLPPGRIPWSQQTEAHRHRAGSGRRPGPVGEPHRGTQGRREPPRGDHHR